MATQDVSFGKSMTAGAIGGLAGSFAMNQFQYAMKSVSAAMAKKERARKGEPEPEQQSQGGGDDATVKAAKAISHSLFAHELDENEKKWAGPAVHYGFGISLGAVYGALATQGEMQGGAGTAYGSAVWLVADEIGVPLAGLSGPPTETPLSGHLSALASHLVFGVVTHLVRKLVLS